MQIAATACLKEGSTAAIRPSFGHSRTNHAILVQFHHVFTILEQSTKPQSISETLKLNPIHYILVPFTCNLAFLPIEQQSMALAVILKHPRYHNHTFLPHNPTGFKKSWHIPAMQAEEMAEGYKELEWDCTVLQNPNTVRPILTQS